MPKFIDLKKQVIEELVSRIHSTDKRDIAKEFGIEEEKLENLIRELANRWLSNPDQIIMIASLLDIAAPREKTRGVEKDAEYIG